MSNSVIRQLDGADAGCSPAERLTREVGAMAGRLAEFLDRAFPEDTGPIAARRAFLHATCAASAGGGSLSFSTAEGPKERTIRPPHALDRLVDGLVLSSAEVDLLLLAGLAEQHEGFDDILRSLHPQNQPRPTVGLAMQLLAGSDDDRGILRRLMESGPAVRAGVIRLEGDTSFFARHLVLADTLWPVLHGSAVWPECIRRVAHPVAMQGLESWFDEPTPHYAITALEHQRACTILVTADDDEAAFERGAALVKASGVGGARIVLPVDPAMELEKLICVHAMARGVVPIVRLPKADGPGAPRTPSFDGYPGPVVICAKHAAIELVGLRPAIAVYCDRLRPSAYRDMWQGILPNLAEDAPVLAARYPVEPSFGQKVAIDLQHLETLEGRAAETKDIAVSVRARSGAALTGGVKLIRPTATWHHLVVPANRATQLHDAVDRLMLQAKVLDEWKFLEGRRGARGVRMLLSGPSGTGKTLAAEVLADALEVDLLIVDLARVVSKWMGETEKNLAEVFEAAERAQAVLLFDEADALFGKRTEVSDAHDRYANLETAYLLTRLERFEGLAVLSTNLRQNIDPAFMRRLEFVVDFDEPTRDERLALWRGHIPEQAPLADDVDLPELAARYPIVGGLIRNASVAAAFMAAAAGSPITRAHLVRAVHLEYQKTGRAFPGASTGPS